MYKIFIVFSLLVASTTFTSQVMARSGHRFDLTSNSCRDLPHGKLEWDSRVWGVGGKVFKNVCKSFHHRNNNQGATFLWVESKTSKGWNRIFAKGNVKCAKDGSWASMTMTERLKVNDFLFRFAYDSADANDNI